jgi:hypothetical protein
MLEPDIAPSFEVRPPVFMVLWLNLKLFIKFLQSERIQVRLICQDVERKVLLWIVLRSI